MINQLPRWVEIGGFCLALIAGSVNAIALLGFNHQGVSHLSGSSSLLGVELAQGDTGAALHLLLILLSFVLGAAISGCVIGHQSLKLGRRYGVALVLESVLLFAAIPLFKQGHLAGALLAAMACGLQNAMATTYSGAVIRTSHLSGMFTDLGIGLGHALRGMPMQTRRLLLCALIISGFFTGAVLGGLLFLRFGYGALMVPATITGSIGLGYAAYRQLQLRQERTGAT